MNAEMYITIYGNFMTMKHLVSEEEAARPFSERAAEAIGAGSVSGALFGVSLHMFPGRGSVRAAQLMVQTVAATPAIAVMSVPVALASANFSVIESAPEEEQRGLWQMFSSALTGTWGGNFTGLI